MSKDKHKGDNGDNPPGEYGLAIQRNANGSISFGPLGDQKRKGDAVQTWELRALAKEYLEILDHVNIVRGVVQGVTRTMMRQAGIVGQPGPGMPPVPPQFGGPKGVG